MKKFFHLAWNCKQFEHRLIFSFFFPVYNVFALYFRFLPYAYILCSTPSRHSRIPDDRDNDRLVFTFWPFSEDDLVKYNMD